MEIAEWFQGRQRLLCFGVTFLLADQCAHGVKNRLGSGKILRDLVAIPSKRRSNYALRLVAAKGRAR